MKGPSPLFFLSLPLLGVSYAGWRLWHILPLALVWRWAAVAALLLGIVSFIFALSRSVGKLPLRLATVVYEVGTSFPVVLLYLVMIFLVMDLGRLLHIVPSHWVIDSARGTLAVAGVMVVVLTCGYLNYRRKVREPITLTNTKSPTTARRIVMMSDMHLGFHNRVGELRRWVDMINAQEPHLVLIAGDIIDRNIVPVDKQHMSEEFRRIKAPIYACLGNHEYYSDVMACRRFFAQAGINLLVDEVATVQGINIVGRDDRLNHHRASLASLMQGVDKSLYTIVLDHQPFHLEEAQHAGVDFQLSGHTHRGQVWPISWVTDAIYEQSHGPLVKGNTQYYVSSGLGIWGAKFRIGTRSEYILATLE